MSPRPVRTIRTNHGWGAPSGKENEIGLLPVEKVTHEDGSEVHYSVWEFSDAERQAIANGYNLQIGVHWVGVMPPISVGVVHFTREDGQIIE